jgi:tRNA threonylcarbamoyladenosine biosynthesis protein TsaE
LQLKTNSEEETILLGERIGRELPPNSVVCFFGDLGAGKTTFIKGLARGCVSASTEQIHSPTFVYLHIYEGSKTLYHFDLYRLHDQDEFLSMGFEEYFFAGGICCIEWSERIAALLPPHCIKVCIDHAGNNERKISITPWDE